MPQAAGQVKILRFLVNIKVSPYMPILFVMQGKCLISGISRSESHGPLSVSLFFPLRVRFISPIFLEVGFPNLVCGCILGWWSVAYKFQITVTLTSDPVFRIIVSGAYLILFEVGIPNLACACILG